MGFDGGYWFWFRRSCYPPLMTYHVLVLIERGPREIALGPRPIGAKRLSLASYRFVAGRVEKQEVSAHVSSDYGCLQSPGAARLGRWFLALYQKLGCQVSGRGGMVDKHISDEVGSGR